MQQRNELWNAVNDASDAMHAAMGEWTQAPTPANRLRVDETMRDFMNRLPPLIGTEAAFQFEAAFQKFLDSNDRGVHFLATLAGRTADQSDTEMMDLLTAESETALNAFNAVEAATRKRLLAVFQRDEIARIGRKWTRALIEELAAYVGPSERWRVWHLCGEHAWKDLPITDSGEHFCSQCCTLWSPNGTMLNVPVDPATPTT